MASPFDAQYNDIRGKIVYYANQYGLPANIGIWQIWYESNFRPTVCSGAGACGIAQFMPATADRFGVNRNDIDSSLNGWGKYMSWLLRQPYINGNISLALAGYNAGEGNVKKYGGIPPFTETKSYVSKIMAAAGQAGNSITPTGSSSPVIATALPQAAGMFTKETVIIVLVGLGALAFINSRNDY